MRADGKRIYLSGPVTGRDWGEAAAEFADAQSRLYAEGAQHVTAPTQLVRPTETRERAMCWCMRELSNELSTPGGGTRPFYDLVVLMPGWEKSDGARFERWAAHEMGIETAELGEVLA